MRARAHLSKGHFLLVLTLLSLLLVCSFLVAMLLGSESLDPFATIAALFNRIVNRPSGLAVEADTILFSLRLPRAFFAIAAGAALSVAGASLQALLRNPLAEPYVLGVSSGAVVGALIAILLFESMPVSQPIGAFIGAAVTVFVVYMLGQGTSGTSTERLILAGVITTTFLWAIIIFMLSVASTAKLRSIAFWLMGDLSGGSTGLLTFTLVITAAAILAIYSLSRMLNLLMIGEESALSSGVSVEKVKIIVYLLASLLTGATVAVVGSIAYVGLIVPHMIRMSLSSDHRLLIPASALLGASILLLADTAARTVIAPRELPVGAITALIGAPLFVYLLRRAS